MSAEQTIGNLVVELHAQTTQYMAAFKAVEVTTEQSMAASLKAVQYATAGMAVALVAVGALGVREYTKFDAAMVKSLAIMGNVSAETRNQMEQTARSIALTTTTSAEAAATGYLSLAQAGLTAEQSMATLATTIRFATAGTMDAARATDLLLDSTTSLGLFSKDAVELEKNLTRVSDVLTMAANVSTTSAEELGAALRTKTAGALRLLNKDVEEGVAVLAAYASAGVKAENAGEQLYQVLRDMQRASIEQRATWDRLGVSVYDTAGKMRPLVEIIEQMEHTIIPLSDELKKTTLISMGFQDRTVSAALSLLGLSGRIREYEGTLRNAGGTTKDVAERQLGSFSAQLTITKNHLNDMLLTIGKELVPVLGMLNSSLQSILTTTDGANSSMGQFAAFLRDGLITTIGMVSDVFYGWKLIMKHLEMAMIALAGGFDVGFQYIKVGVLGLGMIIEAVFRGWQLIFAATIGGIKIGFGEFAVWAKTKAIEVAHALNTIMPNHYDGAWFKAAEEDLQGWKDSVVKSKEDLAKGVASSQQNSMGKQYDEATAAAKLFYEEVAAGTDKYSIANKQLIAEVSKMVEEGAPSEAITKKLTGLGAALADAAKHAHTLGKSAANAVDAVVPPLTEADIRTARYKALTTQLQQAIAYTWEANIPHLKEYNELLAAGEISQAEYNRSLTAMGMSGDKSPFQLQIDKLQELKALNKHVPQDIKKAMRDLRASSSFLGEQTDPKAILQQQKNDLQEQFEAERAAAEQAVALKLMTNEQLLEMDKNYALQQSQISQQIRDSNVVMAQSVLGMAGSIVSSMEALTKKGTGAQKAMFLIGKGIAIAQSIINTHMAAVAALAPPPIGLGPVAGVPWAGAITALGYANVAVIAAQTIAGFEGGGMTPSGSRSGGMDGRGGMLAVLHPDEKVTDLTQENRDTSQPSINVTNYYTITAGVTKTELRPILEQNRRATISEIQNAQRRG